VSFPDDQVRELALRFPGAEQAEEAKIIYFRLPNVTLPDGCTPSPMTLLFRPSAIGDYAYRLYFSDRVKTPKDKNWVESVHILGQTWHAFSWQAKEPLALTQMVARLLRALVC
jgi:hypothetical protein